MLNFARNQLTISGKWSFEPCGEYANPTFKTVNRRKTQKVRELQIPLLNREQNCSRHGLFTNCTPLNPTMCVILPDRGITKIAETVLVSAICGILPFCSVIRLGLEPRTPTLKVLSIVAFNDGWLAHLNLIKQAVRPGFAYCSAWFNLLWFTLWFNLWYIQDWLII